MLINWFTVIAQLVNFLILILLLKHFLYGPIIKAMAEREQKIAARLSEAAQARTAAEQKEAELTEQEAQLQQGRERLMEEARQEAGQWREKALAAARREIEEQRQSWRQGLTEEQASFMKELQAGIAGQVLALARKVVSDLADGRLEEQLIATFLAKVRAEGVTLLDSAGGAEAGDNGGEAGPTVLLRTGIALDEAQRQRVEQDLGALLPAGASLVFQHDPGLGFGLRLGAGDRQVEWNLGRYLGDLEEEIGKALPAMAGRNK